MLVTVDDGAFADFDGIVNVNICEIAEDNSVVEMFLNYFKANVVYCLFELNQVL